jgi:hypothetical protein
MRTYIDGSLKSMFYSSNEVSSLLSETENKVRNAEISSITAAKILLEKFSHE